MIPIWAIVSGKGGVGKSTLAASLAVGLAKRKKNVVLMDMDTGLRNLDMMLGLENRVVFDLVDVIDGNASLEQAFVQEKLRPHLRLLSSSQIHDPATITLKDFLPIIEALKQRSEHIIIDVPSGIGSCFQMCTTVATEVIIVTTPDDIALRDADRVIGLLRQDGNQPLSLVVNRIRRDWVAQRIMYAPEVVSQTLDVPLVGTIDEDEEVLRCLIARKTVIESDGEAWQTMDNILRRLIGEKIPMQEIAGVTKKVNKKRLIFTKKETNR